MRFNVELGMLWVRSVRPSSAVTLLIALFTAFGFAPAARASGSCPNELFRTGPGANLPDCRAYELVSPSQKNGGEVDGGPIFETIPAPMQAAANGEAVTYGSQTPFPSANPASGALTDQYLSRRGPAGWSTQTLTPQQDFPGGVFDKVFGSEEFNLFQGFSEDLTHAFLVAYAPSPVAGAPVGYFNPYLRNDLTNGYQLLSTVTPPMVPPGPSDGVKAGFSVEYAGMSADGSHVLFAADDALTPGALLGSSTEISGRERVSNLYEWSDGHLELVSVLPGDEGGKAVSAKFGSVSTSNNAGLGEGVDQVISANGSRVIWTSDFFESATGRTINQLYLHELTPNGPRTVRISASQRTIAGREEQAHYRGASIDGSSVFFTSCQQLTNDSTAVEGSRCETGAQGWPVAEDEDLYRYDANTGRLTDLSVDPTPGHSANVQGVLGVSEDGSYVYFVATGALIVGAPSGEDVENIYLWHDGATSLIASTTRDDYLTEISGFPAVLHGTGLLNYGLTRVAPDGRYLAFESSEPLTGYDNRPVQAGACETAVGLGESYADKTGRCVEVYEYDAADARLICASCNPDGLPAVGDSVVPMPLHVLSHLAGWQSTTVQQRYLLDDGRLFFDSSDELLPQASNTGKLNVYEYEPDGLGSCQRASGCLSLISSGTSNDNSYFLDASTSGEDVFLVTRQQLVAQDGDEALDVYDARVDGGFSASTPPPCGGEACRAPITPAPAIYQAPPSATFAGPGNQVQALPQTAAVKVKKKTKSSKTKRRSKRKKAKQAARHPRSRHSKRGGHR